MSQKFDTSPAVIGIDIGKNSFHIVGQNQRGAIVLRQKWSRGQVEARPANLPPCRIGMEACVGAHLPESVSHSLIKSSIALTIELAAAPAFATTALACLTASLRSGGLSPRASADPFLYRFATAKQSQYIAFCQGGGF